MKSATKVLKHFPLKFRVRRLLIPWHQMQKTASSAFSKTVRMISPQALQAVKAVPVLLRRNMGIAAPLLQKASDPIQQLFLDKIKEFKSKSSGGKLVDPTPDLQRELKADLDKALKQYGGGSGADMTKFPAIDFPEVKIDPINLEAAK